MPDPGEQRPVTHVAGEHDTLPEDSAASIAAPEFPLVRRGYDRAAVDAYVQRVVRLVSRLDAARSPRAAVRQALDRVGEETSGILAQAHAAADEVTARSRRQAEERLEQASAEAEELVRGARQRTRDLDRDADVIWQERARLLAEVERLAADLERVVRAAHERFPPEPETPRPGADAPAETPSPAVDAPAQTVSPVDDAPAEPPSPDVDEPTQPASPADYDPEGADQTTREIPSPGDEPPPTA